MNLKRNPGLPALYSNVSIVKRNNIAKELRSFKTKQLRSFDFINGSTTTYIFIC